MRKGLISSLVVASIVAASSAQAASTPDSNAELRAQIRKINTETAQLEQEVKALRAELKQRDKLASKPSPQIPSRVPARVLVKTQPRTQTSTTVPAPTSTKIGNVETAGFKQDPLRQLHYANTVMTSPFIGIRTTYLPFDLLYWQPTMNEDLLLLTERQKLQTLMKQHQLPFDRPLLEISGAVETQAYGSYGFNVPSTDQGINLSNVELAINAAVSEWATGYATFNFNNAPVSSGSRQPRGVIYVNRAFLTIGNLNVTPFYFTFGEMYPPYGRYSTGMISTPLTESVARIRSATALLGYYKDNLDLSVFAYSGNEVSTSGHADMQGGLQLGYVADLQHQNHFGFGVSAVSNIADSQGIQNNGISPFPAGSGGAPNQTNFSGFEVNSQFGTSTTSNTLAHRVPAVDANAKLDWGNLTYIAEYVAAVDTFATSNMTFNNSGAEPQAVHAEIDYNTQLWSFPFIFGAAYGHSFQSLALNLPEQSFSAFINASFWKDTLAALEYRYDIDYSSTDRATGAGVPAGTGPGLSGTGRGRNSIIAQLGVYF